MTPVLWDEPSLGTTMHFDQVPVYVYGLSAGENMRWNPSAVVWPDLMAFPIIQTQIKSAARLMKLFQVLLQRTPNSTRGAIVHWGGAL